MAKVTSPLMSLDASGSIAGALTFSKWKGRNYVRQLVIPANPRTTGQQTSREALGSAGRFNSFVQPESTAQTTLNSNAPSGQSGASYFVGKQTQSYATSKTDYNNVSNATEKGYFDSAATTLGISPITIPGDTPVVVPAGLILWNAYQAAYVVDNTLADTPAVDATSAEITEFVGLLSD
jgi:hypothetical protein